MAGTDFTGVMVVEEFNGLVRRGFGSGGGGAAVVTGAGILLATGGWVALTTSVFWEDKRRSSAIFAFAF